jgi:hypothetical protein
MAINIGFKSIVLNAYAVLAGEKPGYAALQDHLSYVQAAGVGVTGYKAALESYFASSTTATLATALLTNLGLSASFTQAQAEAFLNANTGNRVGAMLNLADQLYSYGGADAALKTAQAAYVAKIAVSNVYSSNAQNLYGESINTATGQTINLTVGFDSLIGTALNDSFNARTIGNANTLNDRDMIDGGAGTDTLYVDFTNLTNAITPVLTNIENVVIRAQSTTADSANGNNMYNNTVQIDAQRSLAVDVADKVTAAVGVTRWEDNNSRSDVIIEDVRIGNGQKTSDVTIAMVETDPGNVDFGVYFNQLSLRNASSGNSQINIRLMDTGAAAGYNGADSTKPLLNNPYDTFKFLINGQQATINLNPAGSTTVAKSAETYAQLLSAFQAALAGTSVTASLGADFTIQDPLTNKSVTGKTIVLSGSSAVISTNALSGWYNTLQEPVPADANIYNKFESSASSVTELVTSKVILDDVGMGSTGGDLVIGGMSVGETSTSRGVERFEITVLDNSKLQTINSTNNALREVTIINGATSSAVADAYTTTVTNAGNLTVNGNVNGTNTVTARNAGDDAILAGVNNSNNINGYTADHHGAYGFTDVRLIDGSTMTGKLAFTAQITSDSIKKYVTTVDTQANPVGDVAGAGNVNFNVPGANYIYNGGSGDDTMTVVIDGNVASSRSHLNGGLSDFTFDISGGAGNDAITVTMVNAANTGGAQNWYNNQDINNNVYVSGGAGNDTIRTPGAGDKRIDAGAGDDTVYTDNTGRQTANINVVDASKTTVTAPTAVNGQYVFNTVDQATAFGAVAATGFYGASARDINDLRSDTVETYNFFNSTLNVSFKGIPQTASIKIAGTAYRTTDLEINQSIKLAINSDATLNKLLVATDGPAGSLVVTSLIDGVRSAAELSVSLTPLTLADVNALSAADIAAAGAAYGIVSPTSATVFAAITAAHTLYTTNADYNTAMTNDAAANIVGANSSATSDNLVMPGTENDVIVLGTTVSAAAGDTAGSSNETVVYGAGFGNDVIVNFAIAGNGIDHLDFVALKGTTLTGSFTTDKSINVNTAASLVIASGSTEKAAVEALYNAANVAAQDHVYVRVSTHNVGTVYTVSDAIGANNAVATLQGTIDLADSSWLTLAQANFTNSAAAGYSLLEGPTAAAAVVPVPPAPAGTALTIGSTAPVAATAAADNFTFNVANAKASAPNTQISITGFAVAADMLTIDTTTASGAIKLNALNGVDGIAVQTNGITNETTINFGADANGDVITVTLAGVTDQTLVNVTLI